jgi:hypothetical protein
MKLVRLSFSGVSLTLISVMLAPFITELLSDVLPKYALIERPLVSAR